MTRIYIVDDHVVMRQSYALLLKRMPHVEICGEATTAEEALAQLATVDPDLFPNILLVDMSLPGMSGVDLLEQINGRFPHVAVLIISGHNDTEVAENVIAHGACGYLPKDLIATELSNAIQCVLDGKIYRTDA